MNAPEVSASRRGRIDDIELLRAFAVLLVVLEHAHGNLIVWPSQAFDFFNRYFNGGAGVDLFFAISGFVIVRDLLPRLTACENRTAFFRASIAFWIRRAWRILPSAWLWLALILVAAFFFNRSGVFHTPEATMAGTIAAFFQVYNLHFAHCFMAYDCGANFVYWSLSLEEQFYLALPVLVFLCHKRPARLKAVLLALVAIQLFWPRSLLLIMFRTDALLLGVLIALHVLEKKQERYEPVILQKCGVLRLPLILALVGAIAATGAIASWPGKLAGLAPYRFGAMALVSALLVWLASFDRDYLMSAGAGKRLLLWIGSRSYAIYLIHIPVFYATRELWSRVVAPGTTFDASWTLPFVLAAMPLVLLLAELNFRFIETPLRHRGAAIATRYAEKVRG